jgi:hypothetical protein
MNLDNVKIREFWCWFVNSIVTIDSCFEDNDFINSLDSKLTSLGRISWEIGPGIIDPENNSFVLSPSGNRELLKLTSRIIESAPNLNGWEFYSSKPPKNWKMQFTIKDEQGNDIKIDASSWHYGLLKCDEAYDIIIQAPNIEHLSEDLQYATVEILLDGEIGEETRMTEINCIEIVKEFDSRLRDRHNSIKVLKNHFRQLISE